MEFNARAGSATKRMRPGARRTFMRLWVLGWLALWVCSAGFGQELGPRGPLRTVVIDGTTIRYRVSGDVAVTEGDIVIGNAVDIEALANGSSKTVPREAVIYLGNLTTPNSWPNGTIYYIVDPSLPNQQRVIDAVAHWNQLTPLKVLPRTGQVNYVQFLASSDGGCSSSLGMVGGRQIIYLGSGCPTAAAIHEIGHAFGLMHEQSRRDRDRWLTVLYENIDDYDFDQFHQETNSRDEGYYDYGSIMHYPQDAFSVDGGTSLETVPKGIPIGQRVGLSAQDIDGISRTYGFIPAQTTITTIPEGLTMIVDGERYVAPRAFTWAPGTTHTLSVDPTQLTNANVAQTRNVFVRWTDGGAQSHTFTASADVTAIAAEFQQYFKVTAGVSTGSGTVAIDPPSGDGYYLGGTNLKITAQPGVGQALYTWRGSNVQNYGYGYSAPAMKIPVREAMTLTADFSSAPMVLVDAVPSGAEVLVDDTGYVTPVRFQWTTGTSHTLAPRTPQYSPTASAKALFQQWEDGSTSASRMIAANGTSATYRATYQIQYFLNYDWTGSGTVSANPPNGGSGYFNVGTTVTLTAVPRAGRRLMYWLGKGIGGDSITQTVTMDRPRYAFAIFDSAAQAAPPFRATNAASYASNLQFDQAGAKVAPLEIVTLFGSALGPATLVSGGLDSNGRLTTSLAGYRFLFDGVPAPIVYASDKQTAVVVPAEVAGRAFTVMQVERNGVLGADLATATIIPSIPGMFTLNFSGTGQIAAYNQDGSLNSSTKPAARGSVVSIYATGAGLWDRSVPNGTIMDANLARPQLPVYVRIGTEPVEILYAGSAPTLVNGGFQVNIRIPDTVESGNQPIKLIVGTSASAPGTTIAIQ